MKPKEKMVFVKKVKNPSPPKGSPWKILIVDDEEHVHAITKEILKGFSFEDKGVEIYSGYSGEEAKSLVREHPDSSVILLDVIMEKDQSGLEVVEYIRNVLKNQMVRILLRTGQAGQLSEEGVFEQYEIDNFLEKGDLTAQRLKTTIRGALRSFRHVTALEVARKRETLLRKAAEDANQAKSEFLFNISHELRTPMHGIMGFIEQCVNKISRTPMDKKLAEALLKYLGISMGSSERLLLLLNNLLDLSKLESGKMEMDFSRSSLVKSVETAKNELNVLLPEKNITLKITPPPFDTTLVADSAKIVQVATNLLGNAIKFTPQGKEIEITFSQSVLSLKEEEVPAISMSIRDEGVGIPEEETDKIFDKFVQSSKTKTGAGGTGLGLSICSEIVKAHHGTIKAENSPRGGAVFTVTLPKELKKDNEECLQS